MFQVICTCTLLLFCCSLEAVCPPCTSSGLENRPLNRKLYSANEPNLSSNSLYAITYLYLHAYLGSISVWWLCILILKPLFVCHREDFLSSGFSHACSRPAVLLPRWPICDSSLCCKQRRWQMPPLPHSVACRRGTVCTGSRGLRGRW